ncbi:MAG: DUF6382 domain-containing protein [Lachnospiraceae bacterium]
MRAEYRREWMETYLQVFPEKAGEEAYIEKMLKYQPGGGRLEFLKELKDGQECYCYKVSGKKALSTVYAALPIREDQLRSLLLQVVAALEDAKEYLLPEENFVLEPSKIFVTLPQFTLEFLYVPGYGKELSRQLESLFEYLLNRVDYEDKPAVELLYDCYTNCMKNREGLKTLKKRLEKSENSFPEAAEPSAGRPEKFKEVCPAPVVAKKAEAQSYTSWIKEKITAWGRKKERSEEVQRKECKEEYADSPVPETSRTVLLAVRNPGKQPQLIHEQTGEVILLQSFPFYLGSSREYVSHVIAKEEISRLHFCIRKKGGQYYLSDLNSTNGTYINEKEVLPGTEQLLAEQDRIRAASEEFLFSSGTGGSSF